MAGAPADIPDIAGLLRSSGADGVTEFLQSPEYRRVREVSVSAATSLTEQFTKPLAAERVVRLETVPGNTAVEWDGPGPGWADDHRGRPRRPRSSPRRRAAVA